MQELLKFKSYLKMRRGRPCVLVRWAGRMRRAARGSRSTTWPTARRPSPPSSGPPPLTAPPGLAAAGRPPIVPPPIPPPGFAVDLAPPGDLQVRAALRAVGRMMLSWWPEDGWQRGTVAPRGAFSHVVANTRQTSALRGTAKTMLDTASYGVCWVPRCPGPPRASRGWRRGCPAPRLGGRRLRLAALAAPPQPRLSDWSSARHSLGLRHGPGRRLPWKSSSESRRMFCPPGKFCGRPEAAGDCIATAVLCRAFLQGRRDLK